jgi:hypothetical protein
MPIIKNVEFWFPRLAADRPEQYQNKGARRWKVQIRTRNKAEADVWKKDFGFKVTPEEDDNGLFYRATVSARAFEAQEGTQGTVDNLEKPRTAPAVILGNGQQLDPYTIGNGSVGDVSFSYFKRDDGEQFRTLKGIAVRKLFKRESREEEQFDFDDNVEIIEQEQEEDTLF